MPNRIVRESILDSSRYLSVDEGAQLLYQHMLLLADDFGCLSIEPAFIGRRCFAARPSDERLHKLLDQLAGADMIRRYEHRDVHYAFIPRFRQKLKRVTLKNPQPPASLLEDDFDAQEKFNGLNGSAHKTNTGWLPDGSRIGAREQLDRVGVAAKKVPGRDAADVGGDTYGPQEGKLKEEKGKEGNLSEEEVKTAPATSTANPVDMARALAAKMRLKENLQDEPRNAKETDE